MIRGLKIALVVFVALQGLMYAVQNIVNLDAAYGFVTAVLSMADHAVYPAHFGPPATAPALIWTALWVIIAGELLIGVFGLIGAAQMGAAFGAEPERFAGACKFAFLSCGMSLFVWFGLFMVVGGAYFQMWQTPLGAASYNGAFQYALGPAAVLLFLKTPDR